MKKITVTIMFLLVGFGLGFLAGCTSTGIRHVSADEFVRQAETMEQMNSASGTFYIGTTPTRVYLERTGLYQLVRFHKAMVYWTEINDLPSDLREQLKQGNPPWRPWWEKTKKPDNQ